MTTKEIIDRKRILSGMHTFANDNKKLISKRLEQEMDTQEY